MSLSNRVVCVYSVGARFVGPEATGQTVKKFAERTLCVFIDARKIPDPADTPDIPNLPGYDLEVRYRILSLLPRGWIPDVWSNKIMPAFVKFIEAPSRYDYLQIMVMCGAGYQRSPAIVACLAEMLAEQLYEHNLMDVPLIVSHLTADLAHRIKTETTLR